MDKNLRSLSAVAVVRGNENAPNLNGNVWFFDTPDGVRVDAKICCLPPNDTGFYGFSYT